MTQVCYGGTHFGAQHILDPANNSPWAWHTVAAMLAIWDDPKSWAHLATLPFPKPEGFGRVSSRQQSTNSGDRDSSARSLASDRPDNVIQTTSILQSTDRITTEHRQNYERIISDY